MVQEVQTSVIPTNETTLETIEAIGTSSRKIIEWRQTRWWRSISICEATGNVKWRYVSGSSWNPSEYIESEDLAITNVEWNIEFSMVGNAIRLPVQWWYVCDIEWGIAPLNWTANLYVKVWQTTIYTDMLDTSWTKTATVNFNAWKFDKLTIWADFLYQWPASTAWIEFTPAPTLRLQLL
jgi:hypothetical protein